MQHVLKHSKTLGFLRYKCTGNIIGEITSGGFGPSYGGPVAMGYVKTEFAKIGTELNLIVRGKLVPAQIEKLPFVPQRYFKG